MPEKTMTVSCGCKMHYSEDDTGYITRYEWCVEHEAMASQLRRIMNDCELVLADLARHDGRVSVDQQMKLPPGKTCADCIHVRRCVEVLGCTKPELTTCDFYPNLFRAKPN